MFRKLFGSDPIALRKKADALFESGDFGGALMAFQKIGKKGGDDVSARIGACKDALSLLRLEEAKRLIEQGDIELAEEELNGALEVADGDAAREKIAAVQAKAAELLEELETDV